MSSRLPFIHRATAIRPRGGLRTFLDTPNSVEQVGKLPCPWNPREASWWAAQAAGHQKQQS